MEPDSSSADEDGPPENRSSEEKEEVVLVPASKKSRCGGGSGRPKSYVWDHFTEAILSKDGKPTTQCIYCNGEFLGYSGQLKDLRNHLEHDCDKIPGGIRKKVIKLNKLHRAQQRAKPKPIKQPKENGTNNKRGYVWDHFTDLKNEENKRIAQCVYCDYRLSAFTERMRNHLERNCKEIPNTTRRKVAKLNRIHDQALEARRLNGDELIDQQYPPVQEQQLRAKRAVEQRARRENRGLHQASVAFPSTAASSIYQQPQQPLPPPPPPSRVQQMQPATNFVHVDDDAPSWAVSMAASINSNFNTQFATLSSQLSSLSSQFASQTANVEAQLMNANARLSNIELQLQLKNQNSTNKRKRSHDTSRLTWEPDEDETEEEHYYGNDDSEEEDYEDAEEYI